MLVEKYSVIEGKVGKYISVTKGPKAVKTPINKSKKALELSFMKNLKYTKKAKPQGKNQLDLTPNNFATHLKKIV